MHVPGSFALILILVHPIHLPGIWVGMADRQGGVGAFYSILAVISTNENPTNKNDAHEWTTRHCGAGDGRIPIWRAEVGS